MDKSNVAAEDISERNESLVSESKCADSPVQINSIAIDLDCAIGEMTQSLTHEHFSILGFTAEMRKKDRKVCLPFASEGGDDMNLPPLPVPKFRYWQCLDCILDPESGAGSSSVRNTVEEKDGLQLVQNIDVGNSEGGNSFPRITTEANQVQTKLITTNNSADENPSTGPHNPGKASSPSDGDIPFSSVPLKRKPKLHSLADILKEDESSIPAQQIEPELDHQAWLDAPKKGATKTLYRRKRIVLEDEEEEQIDHPIATAKRSKGPVIESNNDNTTSRSIEISESESERDNSRKNPDINRKNLHKDPQVASETSIADTGPFFKNYLFGEQMHRISDMSKGKMVEQGGYTPPPSNDGSLGVCNNHEKVALDLSLSSYKGSAVRNSKKRECSGRHTEIPDLNESFVEKASDGKASDDIPMEIVELLAKNQQERSLANSRKHLEHVGIHNNNPYRFNFHCTNSGGSSSVSSSTMGFLNFPPAKNCDSNMGQFRQFGPPTPDQHRTELHSGPMNMSGADLLWPLSRKNMSFDVCQPSGLEDQSCKGKNVKIAVTDWSLVHPSSMDAYSNDTIPAMQLLSLIDQRNVSGSSFKRQFSPCSQHPRQTNKNGNPNDQFASSSSFFGERQSNCTNDFPTLMNGARCSKNIFSLGQVPLPKGNTEPIDLADPSNLSARARRRIPPAEVCCTLNRNPADFSAPDARNEFMISGKDLKRRRRKRRVGKDPSRPGGNN